MRHAIAIVACTALFGVAVVGQGPSPSQSLLVGTWKAVFVGPVGPRPQMVDDFVFTFRETSAGLSGTAQAEPEWPGALAVSDLHVTGENFSFVGTGHLGWGVNGVPHCCPRLIFDGMIQADTMTLTMTWGSTESPQTPTGQPVPMEARRLR